MDKFINNLMKHLIKESVKECKQIDIYGAPCKPIHMYDQLRKPTQSNQRWWMPTAISGRQWTFIRTDCKSIKTDTNQWQPMPSLKRDENQSNSMNTCPATMNECRWISANAIIVYASLWESVQIQEISWTSKKSMKTYTVQWQNYKRSFGATSLSWRPMETNTN